VSNQFFDPEKPVIHVSHVDMYQRCPLQFKFRYLEGLKRPPGAALTLGSSVDAAVTHNLSQKIKTKIDLPLNEVLDAFETEWNKLKDDTDFNDSTEGTEKDIGVRLTKLHHLQAAPKINPKLVQWHFQLDSGRNYEVGGTTDLIEEDDSVEDTKTSRKAYDYDAIQNKLQPALYTWAYEKVFKRLARRFRYRVLIKPQKIVSEKVQVLEEQVSTHQQEWFFKIADAVLASVKSGNFVPAPPDHWCCQPRFCGYYFQCRGKK